MAPKESKQGEEKGMVKGQEETNRPEPNTSYDNSGTNSESKVISHVTDAQIRSETNNDGKPNSTAGSISKDEVESGMELSKALEFANKMHWIRLVNESVHSSDDEDIGDIDAVSRDFVVVKQGYVHIHYYYIPISRVEGWDGHVLWLKISELEVKRDYERDMPPDPSRYYVKDYPFYKASYYPEVIMIQPRHKRPVFMTPPAHGIQTEYKCDLCNNNESFNTEDDLTIHIKEQH